MSETKEGFVPNPVLSGLVGICPLIAAARSLAEGVVYGLGTAFCAIALAAILPFLRGLIPDRLKVPATLGLSAFFALAFTLCVRLYSPAIASGLWIYLPLLAVSGLSLTVLRRNYASDRSPADGRVVFGPAAVEAILFLLTASIVGAIRELVGLGTLTLPVPGLSPVHVDIVGFAPLRLLVSPAGGFMLLGFIVAAHRSIVGRKERKRA